MAHYYIYAPSNDDLSIMQSFLDSFEWLKSMQLADVSITILGNNLHSLKLNPKKRLGSEDVILVVKQPVNVLYRDAVCERAPMRDESNAQQIARLFKANGFLGICSEVKQKLFLALKTKAKNFIAKRLDIESLENSVDAYEFFREHYLPIVNNYLQKLKAKTSRLVGFYRSGFANKHIGAIDDLLFKDSNCAIVYLYSYINNIRGHSKPFPCVCIPCPWISFECLNSIDCIVTLISLHSSKYRGAIVELGHDFLSIVRTIPYDVEYKNFTNTSIHKNYYICSSKKVFNATKYLADVKNFPYIPVGGGVSFIR